MTCFHTTSAKTASDIMDLNDEPAPEHIDTVSVSAITTALYLSQEAAVAEVDHQDLREE